MPHMHIPGGRRTAIALAVGLVVAAGVGWWITHHAKRAKEITLFGNVDLRQIELPFNGAERIEAVLVTEGERVARGQVLARLDTGRLEPEVAQAAAEVAAQQQVLNKLRRGARPEEIGQARAGVAQGLVEANNARSRYERLAELEQSSAGRALSRQDLDDARAAFEAAQARLTVNQQALRLQVIGPRGEDIAEAAARLDGARAQLALLQRKLADAVLRAPTNAVVRSRLVEPGEIVTPQRAAFSLAIVDPKWVRAYVTETDLGRVRPGTKATVTVDAFTGRGFEGSVGFISPVAEFTPKTVQTSDLRTSLVYEVRVFVKDPADELRLGMPATVHLPLAARAAAR